MTEGSNSFTCPQCDKKFSQKGKLARHYRIAIRENVAVELGAKASPREAIVLSHYI